jgi:hypothetical protein
VFWGVGPRAVQLKHHKRQMLALVILMVLGETHKNTSLFIWRGTRRFDFFHLLQRRVAANVVVEAGEESTSTFFAMC